MDTSNIVFVRDPSPQPFIGEQLFFGRQKKIDNVLVDQVWQALEQLKR